MIVIFVIISSLLFNIRTCSGLADCNRCIYDHIISYDHIRTTALRTCTGLAVEKEIILIVIVIFMIISLLLLFNIRICTGLAVVKEKTKTAALKFVTFAKVLGDQALDHYHEIIL